MLSAAERARQYRVKHPARIAEQQRVYRDKNRELLRERRRAYVKKYPERVKAYDTAPQTRARRMAGWRRREYGVTEEQFRAMIEKQGGLCAICVKPMTPPHIDHNHKTGRVRGLLCGKCNKAIGLFNEDEKLLDAAKDYMNASGVFTLA